MSTAQTYWTQIWTHEVFGHNVPVDTGIYWRGALPADMRVAGIHVSHDSWLPLPSYLPTIRLKVGGVSITTDDLTIPSDEPVWFPPSYLTDAARGVFLDRNQRFEVHVVDYPSVPVGGGYWEALGLNVSVIANWRL